MKFTGPLGTPIFTSRNTTFPMPARAIASRSAVISSRFWFPSIKYQYTPGLVLLGGIRKFLERASLSTMDSFDSNF